MGCLCKAYLLLSDHLITGQPLKSMPVQEMSVDKPRRCCYLFITLPSLPIFTIFALSAGFPFQKSILKIQVTKTNLTSRINIENTGNQNQPDLKVRVVLVTCIFNIDFLLSWKPADNAKMVNNTDPNCFLCNTVTDPDCVKKANLD